MKLALRRWTFASFLLPVMGREKKPVKLKPVDDDAVKPVPVRLENRETEGKEKAGEPIRLGPHAQEAHISHRLDLPSKDEGELRTHQPGVDAIIETEVATPELLEHNWGETSTRRHSVPWGWFLLIGLAITGTLVWSLMRVHTARNQTERIRVETESTLILEEKAEREASQLIDRIDKTIRDFFNTTSVEALTRLVRQSERVGPLMRRYYAAQPLGFQRLNAIHRLRPLPMHNLDTFWMASVSLGNSKTRHIILEIMESGEPRVDWETLVCYQPMKWDDFAAQRPTGTSLDFRVYVERDSFYSHEFADEKLWTCFRLTALDNEEALFGYARSGSEEAQAMLRLIDENDGRKASLILRLIIPEGVRSPRGVVIESLLSARWIYIVPPDPGF